MDSLHLQLCVAGTLNYVLNDVLGQRDRRVAGSAAVREGLAAPSPPPLCGLPLVLSVEEAARARPAAGLAASPRKVGLRGARSRQGSAVPAADDNATPIRGS
jgi:hypothetical protein